MVIHDNTLLLGIDELSIHLEEPFSVLPLHKIADGIGKSADEHFDWNEKDFEREMEMNPSTAAPQNELPNRIVDGNTIMKANVLVDGNNEVNGGTSYESSMNVNYDGVNGDEIYGGAANEPYVNDGVNTHEIYPGAANEPSEIEAPSHSSSTADVSHVPAPQPVAATTPVETVQEASPSSSSYMSLAEALKEMTKER